MTDPWTPFFHMQRMALEGMAGFARLMTDSWLHLLRQQQAIINRSLEFRRAEDVHVRPKVVPDGPDLKDHYGRRSHDIDVERDV